MRCCQNSKFIKYISVFTGLVVLITAIFYLTSCGRKERVQTKAERESKEKILYYTCGMHPSIKVWPKEYNKGKVNCPICNMKLTPVYAQKAQGQEVYYGCGMEGAEHVFSIEGKDLKKCPICAMPLKRLSRQEADRLRGVVGKIKIRGKYARLAGVKTEVVKRHYLYKKIRTVGKVAYDPQLAIAQEEFIWSLKALDRIKESKISEIKKRAAALVESSKRKLSLLGLSEVQINKLEKTREVQKNLILPNEKMWIYAEVYEYELPWIREGQEVKVMTVSLPGEEFSGTISSINPVLDPKTRSVRFRVEVDNPDLKLKPEMYVDVIITSMYTSGSGEHMVLAIPKEAVLDTGMRRIVWVDKGDGEYEGRNIQVGPEASAEMDGREIRFYPVLRGLKEGELVVTKANFLIDSQSQITGVAASAYGGALAVEEKIDKASMPAGHQH
jgi:multidrug efflux pump subunit AcrA (membrane-fusion protein)